MRALAISWSLRGLWKPRYLADADRHAIKFEAHRGRRVKVHEQVAGAVKMDQSDLVGDRLRPRPGAARPWGVVELLDAAVRIVIGVVLAELEGAPGATLGLERIRGRFQPGHELFMRE